MKEALRLALEVLKAAYVPADLDKQREKAITAIKEALAQPEQEPVVLKWQQAPIRTAWGDDMVVASIAIDNDHTLSLYCERDQTPKVDVMFAQRTWVGLTDKERKIICNFADADDWHDFQVMDAVEAKLKEKNT